MPPKAEITEEMILNTVLEITREARFESVNAGSISGRLQCLTRPIFACYESMEELGKEFLDFAYEFYSQYVENYNNTRHINPCLILPLSYVKSAGEETNSFKLLFISHVDLGMAEPKGFYMEAGNGERERVFSSTIGIGPGRARAISIDLLLYSHGVAVLIATRKITLGESHIEKMVTNVLTALIGQEKPDWALPVSDVTGSV